MDSTLIRFFGNDAVRLQTQELAISATSSLSEQIVTSTLLVIVFMLYNIMIYRYRRTISEIFQIFRLKDQLSKLIDEHSSALKRVSIISIFVAVGAILAFALRCNYHFKLINVELFNLSGWQFVLLATAALLLTLSIYRYLLSRIIGICIGRMDFIRKLSIQNGILFSVAVVIITPWILLGSMTSGLLWNITSTIIAILLIFSILFTINRMLIFFIDKKISIFQWFLYLCGVEILPCSFIIALIFRQ